MLAAKIYALMWFLAIIGAGAVYLTGWFNDTALVIFGFVLATLVFSGVVAVLPSLINHYYSPGRKAEDSRTSYKLTAPEQYVYR